VNKKKWERLEQKIAEQKENARSDSESRQERIKILWDLSDSEYRQGPNKVVWDLAEKKLKPSKTYELKKLKLEKFKKLLSSFSDLPSNDELISLVELVGLQDQEIEYLEQFRREWERIEAYDPEQLDHLSNRSLFAELRPYLESQLSKRKPKQKWEDSRRRYKSSKAVGLIEYEFGGAGEAEWRKHSPCAGLGSRYEPTCLDKIFEGGAVKMHRSEGPGLQDLFGMERHRFGNGLLTIKKGREKGYDYRAVVKIMHRLLSEKPPESKRPRRRKTTRLWLSDRSEGMLGPNGVVALRVLTGIAERSDRLAVSDDIRGAFTAVVCHHIAQGLELRLTEDLKNWIAPLVRRHLG
jgi:hypothetical protein